MSTPMSDVVQEVELTIGQLYSQQAVDEGWIFAERPEIRANYVIELGRLMLRSMVRYAEQKCEHVKYPSNWWQAVKERFAPAWFLRRWPVLYTVWEPFVIYPDIKLPDRQHFVRIRQLSYFPEFREHA